MFFQLGLYSSQVSAIPGVAGIELDRLGKVPDGLCPVCLPSIRDSQVVVELEVIRKHLDRVHEVRYRLRERPRLDKKRAEVKLRVQIIRPDSHRFSALSNGVLFSPGVFERDAQAVVGHKIVFVDGYGMLEEGDAVLPITDLIVCGPGKNGSDCTPRNTGPDGETSIVARGLDNKRQQIGNSPDDNDEGPD